MIFSKLRDVERPTQGLRDAKQIYNVISYHKQKELGQIFGRTGSDQMLKIFRNMQLDTSKYGKFVRQFYTDDLGKPSIMCYEQWQVEYTKRMCKFNPLSCSIIEHDKTYNMCVCFLTHYAFQTMDFVLREDPDIHPIIPGVMYFHPDSLESTFDNYFEKLATLLKIENNNFKYSYIMINDGEAALKNSKEKFFPNALHLQCEGHMGENLFGHCKYKKNSRNQKQVLKQVMMEMAGADSLERFEEIKEKVPKDAFEGNYFEKFCKDLEKNVKARLEAPHVIPKHSKTNAIEANNARCKVYIQHTPRTMDEVVFIMKQMVESVKNNMIQALYGEGPWAIATGSNLKRISKKAWERKPEKMQQKYFMRAVCGVDPNRQGGIPPRMPPVNNMVEVTAEERRRAEIDHRASLSLHNERAKQTMLAQSKEDERPLLNITGHVKKKLNQRTSSVANRTNPHKPGSRGFKYD